MSVTVNDKGGNEQRVNLIKRGRGEMQHVMLKNTLIKKAENYHLVTDRFVTNNLPGIMQNPRMLIEIRPRGGLGALNGGFAAGAFLIPRCTFTPSTIYSVGRLAESMAQFFAHFNFGLYMRGANYSAFPNLAHYVPTQPQIAANTPYDLRNNIPEDQVTQHVSLGFEADGSLQLVMSSQFLSNFFIILDNVFAKQVGFPQQIYHGVTAANAQVMSNQPGVLPLISIANTFNIGAAINAGRSIISTNSIFRTDDRISFDVEITLPLARTIDVHDKKEFQTYLLSRFMVTDYIRVDTIAQQRGGFLLTKSMISDKLSTGFTDLVADNPGTHTAQLKNGQIQELDVRLILRYKSFEIINNILTYATERKTIEMETDGVYDLLLSFNKRV
jgi:hypothetical protein